MGLPSEEIEKLLDVTGFRTQRLPLDRHGESQTLDAKVASKKLLGGFDKADLGGLSFWTQPNSWHHFMSDHIVTFSVIPLSAGKTLVRTKWLVHKDAKEGIDYDVKNLTAVWNATNDWIARSSNSRSARDQQRVRAVFAVHGRSRRKILGLSAGSPKTGE